MKVTDVQVSRETDNISDMSIEEMFYNVVKPGIVKMAVEDKLPTDLNTLHLDDIMKHSKFEYRKADLYKLAQVLSLDEEKTIEDAYAALIAQSKVDENVMADVVVTLTEDLEYSFTVKSLLELIS